GVGDDRGGHGAVGFGLAAVDRVDVERGFARAVRYDGHGGRLALECGVEGAFEGLEHGTHGADRAVAQEGHRAVCDATFGFDLRPPDATMTDADAVDVQGLGDDHVIDARLGEPAAFGEVGHAAEAAGFLVDGAGNFDRAGNVETGV